MGYLPRLFGKRERNKVPNYQVSTPQEDVRYLLTGPGRRFIVTQGPSLEEWRRRIRTDPRSCNQWNELANALGFPDAEMFIDLVADKIVLSTHGSLDDLSPADMAGYMQNELDRFNSRRNYVNWLMMRSLGLGRWLNGSIRPTTDYYANPLRAGQTGRALAIDQAANWICSGFTAALPLTRQLLDQYIYPPVAQGQAGVTGGQAPGITEKCLRSIHRQVAPTSPRFRVALIGVPYPTSVGGDRLLPYIFRLGSRIRWPPFGSPEWDSIAMFYLASIVHVQGFADGNKRAGHFAYSIVMIKNTLSFKAPSIALEDWLFRMES